MIQLFIDLLLKSDTQLNRLGTGREESVAFILSDIASVDEYCLCGKKKVDTKTWLDVCLLFHSK